jgi:toxin secretion/phage lysis holin
MQIIVEYLAGFVREFFGDAVVKTASALLGGVFLGWLGGPSAAVTALIVLMSVDFLLGFCRAWKASRISPSKLKYGFLKFFLYALAIIAAHHVDEALNSQVEPLLHVRVKFRDFLIIYLAVCDGLSIFKHLHCLGVPIPHQIINRLETLKDCKITPDGPKERAK